MSFFVQKLSIGIGLLRGALRGRGSVPSVEKAEGRRKIFCVSVHAIVYIAASKDANTNNFPKIIFLLTPTLSAPEALHLPPKAPRSNSHPMFTCYMQNGVTAMIYGVTAMIFSLSLCCEKSTCILLFY